MVKQLRYLERVVLNKITRTIQSNGSSIETATLVGEYAVQAQVLNDEVSSFTYGARLNNILRLSSPNNVLENYLLGVFNYSSDNITKYQITYNSKKYRVITVFKDWVDVELI